MPSTISQRIKFARKGLGLTQQALAESLGVSRVAITNWESDNEAVSHSPMQNRLNEIAKALNVSLEWLCNDETELVLVPQEQDGQKMFAGYPESPYEALEPFANLLMPGYANLSDSFVVWSNQSGSITVGDLRRASRVFNAR